MFRRIKNLFRPRTLEADIREELEFHRSQTAGSFGNLTSIQEQTREASTIVWLETLLQDIRIACRLLRRVPSLTGIALLSITLSVGTTAVVFAAIKSVLLNPLPYKRARGLVQFRTDFAGAGPSHNDWIFWNDAQEITRRTRTLEAIGIYQNAVYDLGGGPATPPEALYGLLVSANMFPTLGVAPMLGRNISPDEDRPGRPYEMILSYGLWKRRFNADRHIVGQTVKVNGRDCLVIGVMPPDFNFPLRRDAAHTPSPYVEFWAPLLTGGPGVKTGAVGAVARLRPGVSLVEAQQDLASISSALSREFPSTNRDRTLWVSFLWDRTVGSARSALWFLMAAALLFLLIGCANVANLLLARGLVRQREISVRMAIGAARARIVRQLLTENCVLSMLGGYVLTVAAWKILPALAPVTIPRLAAARADWTILAFSITLALVNGILFGIAPALRSAGSAMPAALGDFGARGGASGKQDRMRTSLVIGEVAITVTLVLIGGQLLGSFIGLLRTDPGFEADRVLASVVLPELERYRTPEERGRIYQRFLDSVRALPGVESAGTADALPFSGENHGGLISNSQSAVMEPHGQAIAEIDVVGGEYLQTLGVKLRAGRWFRQEDMKKSSGVAIINDVVAKRFWPEDNAIGKQICVDCTPETPSNWKRVVGVVSGIRHSALDGPPPQNVYLAEGALENADFLVVKTSRPMGEMAKAVRRAIAGVDPNQPVLLSASMQSLIEDSVADRRFIMSLLAITGCLALLMSAAGIYGVTSYTTSRRTQEFGIRMALGATPGSVHILVFRQGFLSVCTGLAIGLGLAVESTRALRGLVVGLGRGNGAEMWIAACVVSLTAALACWIPAWRATRIDPMSALRQD
ncbi:MAG: ABC transporter permease [Acidobacteriota bacterium]|nr:ABC transporter permease [Acidobacteriota bacterium]